MLFIDENDKEVHIEFTLPSDCPKVVVFLRYHGVEVKHAYTDTNIYRVHSSQADKLVQLLDEQYRKSMEEYKRTHDDKGRLISRDYKPGWDKALSDIGAYGGRHPLR